MIEQKTSPKMSSPKTQKRLEELIHSYRSCEMERLPEDIINIHKLMGSLSSVYKLEDKEMIVLDFLENFL